MPQLPPRIKHQTALDALFRSPGSAAAAAFPVKAVALERACPEGEPSVMLFVSAAKRHFKHAVDRNRAKRQLREAFRLGHADTLAQRQTERNRQLLIGLLWLSDEPKATDKVSRAVAKALDKTLAKLPS